MKQFHNRVFLISFLISFIPLLIPSYVEIVLLNPTFALMAISIARFIAATGTFSIYINMTVYIARTIAPKIKRRKREAKKVRKFLVLGGYIYISAVFTYYLLSVLLAPESLDIINIIAGLSLTMLTTFMIPIAREELPVLNESKIKVLLDKANYIALGIKRAYYEKLIRDYGKAMALEFISLKFKVDRIRERIFNWLFPIIVIVTAPILPVFILGAWVLLARKYKWVKVDSYLKLTALVILFSLTVYIILVSLINPVKLELIAYSVPYMIGLLIPLVIYIKFIGNSF